MMASRLTQWVPQEQKSVTMKSLQKVSKCQNMTPILECFDMESIIKGKVFPSAMSSQLFPYSFNFTIKGGDHCFGCDKMTKDWLVLNGWGWKDEI